MGRAGGRLSFININSFLNLMMYEKEMLGFLFEAYKERGFELWKLPKKSPSPNGVPPLDEIVKEAPVDKLEPENVYLAVPLNHGKRSVEEAVRRLFVQTSGFYVAMYTFAIRDGVIGMENDGPPVEFTYLEFINAVEKLPSLNGVQKNAKNS